MTEPTLPLDANIARANQTYGGVTARIHDASYSLEHALGSIEALISGDDWRSVGDGFSDINAFMDSLKLHHFGGIVDQRKRIATRIKQLQPDVSNRRIAKALGVSDMTVARDLAASNVAGDGDNAGKIKASKIKSATNVALGGFEAAKLVARREEHRERIAAKAGLVRQTAGDGTMECRQGDFVDVLSDLRNVDAIITDPPYEKAFLPRLRDLAALADRILKPDGVMVVLMGKGYLPDVYAHLAGYRQYRWTGCFYAPGASNVNHTANVLSSWKPLLIYGGDRNRRFYDIFKSSLADAQAGQAMHKWGQDAEAFKKIIEAFTDPGDLIVDPFAGGGCTLLAAKATGRHCVGAEIDPTCEVFELEQLTKVPNSDREVMAYQEA